MKLSGGEIDAIIAGVEGVTAGPWVSQGVDQDGEERGHGFIVGTQQQGLIAAALAWPTEYDSGDFERVKANAAHIARLDPATVLALATEVKALREALTEIAKQKLRDEVAKHGPLTQHDFAGGYDVLVCLARAALGKTETHSGTDE